ncbi:MAG: response regulator [Chloroflexi bacterium]|nr:response regulator [Chloroflexota bacterium]
MTVDLVDIGEQKYILNSMQDITERKRAEVALEAERSSLERRVMERTADLNQANADLARAARLKDEFLSSMSHELRTPLNGILALSESLEEGVYGQLTAQQRDPLHTIAESGYHLLSLINDILDLAKIEASKLELQVDQVNIERVCQASLRLVKEPARTKQLKVAFSSNHTMTTVEADERRLKQMIVNLLSNAIKFTPEGGRIGLDVMGDPESQTMRFTVWDTGIGIPAEKMGLLFQTFTQLDSSLARQYNGTGLGLALVKRLAELHGGSVGVESTPDQGSRFYFDLPWIPVEEITPGTETSEQTQAVTPQVQPTGAGKLILLAEDNLVNQQGLSNYLLARGYRVVLAQNGAEAIERAFEFTPDLILMDIQMPVLDGLEAIRRLRAQPTFALTPIIALTALAMPGDRERCLIAGATEYLAKPVGLKALVQVMETLYESVGR